jgi:glycerol-3-phosphate dehydrogenase
MAQVKHSIEQENALYLGDFLLRRGSVGTSRCQGLDAVNKVADEMGNILNWSEHEKQAQIAQYKEQIALSQKFR